MKSNDCVVFNTGPIHFDLKSKKPVKNQPIATKAAEAGPPGDDDLIGDEEEVETEDLELDAFMDKFVEMKEELALINHEITEPSEIKGLRNLTPVKCDIKKYMPSLIPRNVSIMSWNVDFHLTHIGKRSVAIVDLIETENHDIILLQEVTTLFFNYMVSRLKNKYAIVRQENNTFYYTATLLRKDTVKYESHKMIYFKNTSQGRSILFTKVSVGGAKLELMNVHLESQASKEKSQIRTAQLKKCMTIASSTSADSNVVIGGDMNIREWELKDLPLPKKTCDVWVQQGKRQDAQYTWDMTCNKNLTFEVPVPPKRFDRIFFRSSTPETLTPEYFGLTGKDKLQGVEEDYFLSDHWAIVSRFSLHLAFQYIPVTPSTEKPSSAAKVSQEEKEEALETGSEPAEDGFVKENWYDDD